MKSTLKIDYERGLENYPVIKIIVPTEERLIPSNPEVFWHSEDDDVRDKLIRDLLHSPLYSEPNHFFNVKTAFPIEAGTLTTIGAIKETDLFDIFHAAILQRMVPYETRCLMNKKEKLPDGQGRTPHDGELEGRKINEFFDWLKETERCPYPERQPK